MNEKEISQFFECIGEIWRDITAIEFLMRCAIAKNDGEINLFPKPPYTKGKTINNPPKSFLHFSFENVVNKFNKRFPKLHMPSELVELRDAMAHGIILEINNSGVNELIKFKEIKGRNEIQVEFSMELEPIKMLQIRQSLKELRGYLMKELGNT